MTWFVENAQTVCKHIVNKNVLLRAEYNLLRNSADGRGFVMETGFATLVGYALGLLVIIVVLGIFLKPVKTFVKFLANSLASIGIVALINYFGAFFGIHIGINPISAIALGLLGIPAIVLILIAQIFY